MAIGADRQDPYFVFGFPLSDRSWREYAVRDLLPDQVPDDPDLLSWEIRTLAETVNRSRRHRAEGEPDVPAEVLLALRTLNQALRHVARRYFAVENPGGLARCRAWADAQLGPANTTHLVRTFCELFPPLPVALERETLAAYAASDVDPALLEMMLLFVNVTNPATGPAAPLFDDNELRQRSSYAAFVTGDPWGLPTPAGQDALLLHLLETL